MNFENETKNAYEEYLKKSSEVTYLERKQALNQSIASLIKPEQTHTLTDQKQIDAEIEAGYPFLGSILQCMSINYTEIMPTAGVMFNNKAKKFEMLINPYFYCRVLSEKERRAVLLHEMYHITFKHVYYDVAESTNRQQLNIAMDLVINQFIRDLPSQCMDINNFRDKTTGQPFPANKTTEFYYDLLNNAETKNPNFDPKGDKDGSGQGQKTPGQGGSGNGMDPGEGSGGFMDPSKEWVDIQEMLKKNENAQFDEHAWDDSDANKQEKMEALNDLIKRTMIKSSYSHSTLPKHIQDMMKHLDTELKKLDYKAILLSTLKKSLPSRDRRQTWLRPSRRFGDIAPGSTASLMPKIEVFIDTSGSISHEEINEFLKITNNFLTIGVDKCNVSFFHTALYHTEKFKKNFKVENTQFNSKLQSGGTDLQQVFERIKKVKPDLSIIITDGYYGDVSMDTRGFPQVVFIISKGGTTEHPLNKFGKSVKYAG